MQESVLGGRNSHASFPLLLRLAWWGILLPLPTLPRLHTALHTEPQVPSLSEGLTGKANTAQLGLS